MEFRFYWVFIFILLLIIMQIILFTKFKNAKSIFPGISDKLNITISQNIAPNKIRLKKNFLFLGLLALGLASTGPQIGKSLRPIERKGVGLVIALDISTSMDSDDVSPSRLKKAKFEIGNLFKNLNGDRVAIIVFAGSSHLYLPLTTDYEAALLFLDEIDTSMIPSQGTSISSALKTAINSYQDESEKHKVLILISDGENHDGEAVQISKQTNELNMVIYTIGVGSLQGGLVPINTSKKNKIEFKRDSEGRLVTSIPNSQILKDISNNGNGKAFWFSNNGDSHDDILKEINNLDKMVISTHEYADYEDRYQIFASISFLFLFTYLIIPTRKNINE